jgi:heme exporter protein A
MITALRISDLALRRGGRALFSGLDLELAPGEACAVTGANGAGKTSLLRAVAGLLEPDAGDIGFGGEDPTTARAGGLHFLGHHDGLKPARTAAEEFGFWTRWDGASGAATALAIQSLELAPLMPLEIRRLSAGQRRRIALARLVAARRPLWLLDEPMSPLDAAWRARFGELIADHLATGGMVLAAVHDPLPGATRALEISGEMGG